MQNTEEKRFPKIGEVYMLRFDGSGSVQTGLRPGVIFQNNIGNLRSPNTVVLPLTTSLKKLAMPTHVLLKASDTGLARDSMVLCENPQCVPKESLGRYITTLPSHYMRQIAAASIMASGAVSFMEPGALFDVWQQAAHLNAASEEVA